MEPIRRLQEVSHTFGPRAAREKLRLLAALEAVRRPGRAGRSLRSAARAPGPGRRAGAGGGTAALAATLDFMRAYPDDARVRRAVREAIAALPPAPRVDYPFSWGVVRRLVRLDPQAIEIDWAAFEEQGAMLDTLDLLVTPGEAQGLEDTRVTLEDWFARCRPEHAPTDLAFFAGLLERAALDERVRAHLYERCDLPLRWAAPHRCAIALPAARIHFQRDAIDRGTVPLAAAIRRPLAGVTRGGRTEVDVAVRALAARSLEIYPLIHPNEDDVTVVDCGRGFRIAVIGVPPGFRSPLETLVVFVVFRNEAPIAYGPAGIFLGCCELGVNLFPEFRGGEIRFVYAQIMRVLHHLAGVEHFHLTRYAMGEDNDEALASGAFWFYRRLGFRALNPAVEALARAEEARMAADPKQRSDRATLRRLSRTEASFDLSGGRCAPFDFGALGMAQSRFIAVTFDGDRAAAETGCARWLGKLLGVADSPALRALAPAFALIHDLPLWPRADLQGVARIVRAKDGRSELPAARAFKRHRRLGVALRALAERAGRGR